MSVRVYKYSVSAPTENAALVRQQMRAAHRYRNVLVEIERGRRAAIREAVACPEIEALESIVRTAQAESLRAWTAVRDARSSERTKKISPELTEWLSTAKRDERQALLALGKARHARTAPAYVAIQSRRPRGRGKNRVDGTWPEDITPDVLKLAERLFEIDEIANGLQRNAREYCGVFWGTYLLIEAEHDASRKMPFWDGIEPNNPRFVRWDGNGAVGVQIQTSNPMFGKDLIGDDTRLRAIVRHATMLTNKLGKPLPQRDPSSTRSRERVALDFQIRVGSDGRDPIFARVSARPDRPIPDDGKITGAKLIVRPVADKEDWFLLITVDEPERVTVTPKVGGAVAVDLGWRILQDKVRVATWVDEYGSKGEIVFPWRIISRMRKCEDLQAIRAKNFEMMRDFLLWLLPEDAPEWARTALARARQWHAQSRLASFVTTWRSQRWAGDSDLFETCEAWRKQDKHLWTWEVSQRSNVLNARGYIYRVAAVELARKYDTLVIEKFDLRRFAKRVESESTDTENETARGMRVTAAPSVARQALTQSFKSRNRTVVERSAVNTTRNCSACGCLNEFDAAKELRHTCSSCGVRWDQDENAGENLLSGYVRERSSGVKAAGAARRTPKWAKTHAKKPADVVGDMADSAK